jgi:NADH-quinone oxidoreductase subunit L
MMVMTFWGGERFREQHHDHDDGHHAHGSLEPHESPLIMTIPLIVLAVLSTVGGFIGIPYALSSFATSKDLNVIERTLDPVIAPVPGAHAGSTFEAKLSAAPMENGETASAVLHETHSVEEINAERLLALISVLIAAAGIAAGWFIFKARPLLQLPRILENKYYVDEIYDAGLIHPIEAVSREGLWKSLGVGVIDGFLHSIGEAVTEAGRLGRYLQAGLVRGYAAIILFGALLLIAAFAFYSFQALAR